MVGERLRFDLIVVGGGLVGATLATALGDTPLRVAVLEGRTPDLKWPRPDYDIRVSALTRASQHIFEAIGAWPGMQRRRVAAYRAMQVWDACGGGEIRFDAAEIGEPDLGQIVENSVILAALHERLAVSANITLLCPVQPIALRREVEEVEVTLADGRHLVARLLVGADGTHSFVREQARIPVSGWFYDQHALTANIRTSQPHRAVCRQRFLPDGPLAFLPLAEPNLSSIVWSTTPDRARALEALPEPAFLDALQRSFGDRLGRMEAVEGPRGRYPLMQQRAEAYCAERVALVGNAAHAIHPLAGQGLNLGLLDAAALAEVLLDTHRRRRDIGALTALRRYERWRKGDNLAMAAAMDGFNRLFGATAAPVRWARNLGLLLTDRTAPLKRLLMRHAMGLGGDLPALARPHPAE